MKKEMVYSDTETSLNIYFPLLCFIHFAYLGISSLWQGWEWLCFKCGTQNSHVQPWCGFHWWWVEWNDTWSRHWRGRTSLLWRVLQHDDHQLNIFCLLKSFKNPNYFILHVSTLKVHGTNNFIGTLLQTTDIFPRNSSLIF